LTISDSRRIIDSHCDGLHNVNPSKSDKERRWGYMTMVQEMVSKDTFDRAKYIEDMRQKVYESMKKAEQAKDWALFDRYADMYIKLSR